MKSAASNQKDQDVRNAIEQPIVYDSLSIFFKTNSIKELNQYVGQEIIFRPDESSKRKGEPVHYKGVYTSIAANKSCVYSPTYYKRGISTELRSNYDSLQSRVFKITKLLKAEDGNRNLFTIVDNKDTLYINPQEIGSYHIVGYIEHLKKPFKGKKYYRCFTGSDLDFEETEYFSGKPLKDRAGQLWVFIDVIVDAENGWFYVLLKNSKGESIGKHIDCMSYTFLEQTKANRIKSKYGEYCFKKMLNSEVYVGMPAEAARLSWGEPNSINKASYGDQWVYDSSYLYIRNGKVTSWN